MHEFTENDLRAIERERDLPPDEPYAANPADLYAEAREYLRDAVSYLMANGMPHAQVDPEEAIRCAREAIARIEATL